jgi:hypothetical protein
LQGPTVGEFSGRQSAVKLKKFSAASITTSQSRVAHGLSSLCN